MDELALIFEAEMIAFPPRLPEQPIFYPVLNQGYAEQIARDWNTQTSPFAGYVTEFEIPAELGETFARHVVGARMHEELWVPAEDLGSFNDALTAPIRVVRAFFGSSFRGHIPSGFGLRGKSAMEQFQVMAGTRTYSGMDFLLESRANRLSIFLNFPFWVAAEACDLGVDEEEKSKTLHAMEAALDDHLGPAELLWDAECVA